MTATGSRPKLRAVDARPFAQHGRRFVLLRDPLGLCEQVVLVPQELAPLLALCDGTRDLDTLAAALAIRYGLRVRTDVLRQLVEALDEALLLENGRYTQARAAALAEYRQAPFRRPTLAGKSYPEDPDALRALLQGHLDAADDGSTPAEPLAGSIRGLITPHIDFDRGASVYARVWTHAAEAVRSADLAIVLGTNHHGGEHDVTLTRQSYATPFGVLPTARDVVDAVAGAVGEELAFAGELDHRSEHSIELTAVWLHFTRGGQPCELLPVLCGPLARFVYGEEDPGADPALPRLVEALQAAAAGRRAVVIAAADLSHVGPAFGGHPLDLANRARVQAADEELLERACGGDADGFLGAIRSVKNRHNVCGVSPIYLALRILGAARGERVAYAACPADEHGASAVTVCGVAWE